MRGRSQRRALDVWWILELRVGVERGKYAEEKFELALGRV